MTSLKKLQDNIEIIREILANNIKAKESLLDPEIMLTSELLDKLLNEYHRLNKKGK